MLFRSISPFLSASAAIITDLKADTTGDIFSSPIDTFQVSGTNLTSGTINIGPLSGFGFSLNNNGPFTQTVSFSNSSGLLSPKNIYVVFNPSVNQVYSGNVPVSGGGATTINIIANGNFSIMANNISIEKWLTENIKLGFYFPFYDFLL